jgi:hypothetical protein
MEGTAMGFKSGFLLGLGAGYVMGTRAGRERYEEIQQGWSRLTGSPQVREAANLARQTAAERLPDSIVDRIPGIENGPDKGAATQAS